MKQSRAIAALGALAAFVLAPPLAAQDSPPPAAANVPPPATTNSSDTIGPAQLRDFDLNGRVTREAAPQPSAAPPGATASPSATERRTEPAGQGATTTAEGPARRASTREPATATATAAAAAAAAAPSAGFDLPPPTPAAEPTQAGAFVDPAPMPADDGSAGSGLALTGMSFLPWLLAALAAAAAGLWFFGTRQRSRYAVAGGADDGGLAFAGAEPAPQPLQRAMPDSRALPPAPPRPAGGGIVSTRLRPWLDLELEPSRAIFGEHGMTIEFELRVRNSGAAPARDVLIEAAMFNAGPAQDEEVGAFFAHPETSGERMRQLLPLQQIAIKSSVTLPLAEMRQFELGGRKLFVPLLAVNAIYGWSTGEGQSSASYLIGRDGKGEKMAPLRLDMGPRLFRGLGAREHSAKVRR